MAAGEQNWFEFLFDVPEGFSIAGCTGYYTGNGQSFVSDLRLNSANSYAMQLKSYAAYSNTAQIVVLCIRDTAFRYSQSHMLKERTITTSSDSSGNVCLNMLSSEATIVSVVARVDKLALTCYDGTYYVTVFDWQGNLAPNRSEAITIRYIELTPQIM